MMVTKEHNKKAISNKTADQENVRKYNTIFSRDRCQDKHTSKMGKCASHHGPS